MRSRTSLVLSSTPISVEHVRRLGVLTLVSAALLCVATRRAPRMTTSLPVFCWTCSVNRGETRPRRTRLPANNPSATIAHAMHFIPGLSLQLAPRELNKAIGLGLTTFPLPSSSGGFAYTTDPATGEIRPRQPRSDRSTRNARSQSERGDSTSASRSSPPASTPSRPPN